MRFSTYLVLNVLIRDLLDAVGESCGSTILVGDFNSKPDSFSCINIDWRVNIHVCIMINYFLNVNNTK